MLGYSSECLICVNSILSIRDRAYESGGMDHACNPNVGRLGMEDCGFEVSLGYIVTSKPSWVAQRAPISKKQKQTCLYPVPIFIPYLGLGNLRIG